MATSYVEDLLDDLESLAAIAPEEGEVATAARRLGRALAASAATRMLEVMTRAALDLSSRLSSGHVEVRIVGEDPELVFVEDEPPAPKPPAEDPTTARITLRLPQRLKEEIEAAAERDGVSVNAWVIRSLERSTATTRHHQAGNRLRGFARA